MRKWDVVITLFPFADGKRAKIRPAVLYAGPWQVGDFSVCWVLMITSALRKRWPDDVEISDLARADLPGASLVRVLKLACVDVRNIVDTLGALDTKTRRAVQQNVQKRIV